MEVHVIVPADIDDPLRPSGGNVYDRRVIAGLRTRGWTVHEHTARAAVPEGALVLVDGLVAEEAERARQVVLVHMPRGIAPEPGVGAAAADAARERAVLEAAAAIITTSAWTRRWLIEHHDLAAERIHVAEPGVGPAPLAPGTATGGALLCVAAVTPGKGHDVLLDALAAVADLDWSCTCAGSLVRDPAFAATVRGRDERVRFVGPLVGTELDRAYAAADLLVLPSHAETYGMVVTEALARGVPVLATDVGGVSEALGGGGLLVGAGDPAALAAALRIWLEDPELRARLRRAARARRRTLRGWAATAAEVAGVLAGAATTELAA